MLFPEKYCWDTVTCNTPDPLASDSDDKKKIQKAIQESKQLMGEKKRAVFSEVPRAEGVIPCSSERRVILKSSHVTGISLCVFIASSQNTLPGTAVLSMSKLEQELLGSPQETINNQATKSPLHAPHTLYKTTYTGEQIAQ